MGEDRRCALQLGRNFLDDPLLVRGLELCVAREELEQVRGVGGRMDPSHTLVVSPDIAFLREIP